jgi:hypothetical protein
MLPATYINNAYLIVSERGVQGAMKQHGPHGGPGSITGEIEISIFLRSPFSLASVYSTETARAGLCNYSDMNLTFCLTFKLARSLPTPYVVGPQK